MTVRTDGHGDSLITVVRMCRNAFDRVILPRSGVSVLFNFDINLISTMGMLGHHDDTTSRVAAGMRMHRDWSIIRQVLTIHGYGLTSHVFMIVTFAVTAPEIPRAVAVVNYNNGINARRRAQMLVPLRKICAHIMIMIVVNVDYVAVATLVSVCISFTGPLLVIFNRTVSRMGMGRNLVDRSIMLMVA
jgi:hypothetical protein